MCFSPQFQCDLIYTFFHPLLRDEKAEGIDGIAKCTGETTILKGSRKGCIIKFY